TVTPPGILATHDAVDGDPLSALLVPSPAHGTLRFNTHATFTYPHSLPTRRSSDLTYKANDGQLDSPTNATVSITVTPVNDAPGTSGGAHAGTPDTTPEHTTLTAVAPGVLANDTDVDGDPLTAILVTSPAHGTLSLN